MKKNIDYYFKPIKIIRDLVHGYINLTAFDLELIDTIQFQRLNDIRQLTCQHVYPNARHTRFEHSLGVLQLMRLAIKHINTNKVLTEDDESEDKGELIGANLQLNASIAALLHDVGHCPFSHLGEKEIDKERARELLASSIVNNTDISNDSSLYKKINKENASDIGSCHELTSCIVILNTYSEILNKINIEENGVELKCDYELIIRSILGIEYDDDDFKLLIKTEGIDIKKRIYKELKLKNLVISLLNSKIFDMDKLDYIMRDSFYTGIGTPKIDTKRIFRNMYLNNNYKIIFTSKAVPALQNMIDARDGLYMYVYNHHTVVLSDFLNSYILRKLSHNTYSYLRLVCPELIRGCNENACKKKDFEMFLDYFQISNIGLVPINSIFSVNSIIYKSISDSDWISLLNIINSCNREILNYTEEEQVEFISGRIRGEINDFHYYYPEIPKYNKNSQIKNEDVEELAKKIISTLNLINNYKNRKYLSPWWKTAFEFSIFMQQYFPDDNMREKICEKICGSNEDSAEFRSQIAQGVKYIANRVYKDKHLTKRIDDGDFFIVQRPIGFLDINKIEKLIIYLNASERVGYIGKSEEENSKKKYYGKKLNKIIPQKDYYELLIKDSFYIFSNRKDMKGENISHHDSLMKIFAFVCAELIDLSNIDFNNYFLKNPYCTLEEDKAQNKKANTFREKMYNDFKNSY